MCCIDDLLYTVYIRSKSSHDNTCILVFFKNSFKGLTYSTLRLCKTRTLCIGGIQKQGKNTFLADFCKSGQINSITENRCVIHLKVAGMHYDTCW